MSYSKVIQADSIQQALEIFYKDNSIDIVYAVFDVKSHIGKKFLSR